MKYTPFAELTFSRRRPEADPKPLGDWPRMTPAQKANYVADLKRRARNLRSHFSFH